jgi:replicative DNA helicase
MATVPTPPQNIEAEASLLGATLIDTYALIAQKNINLVQKIASDIVTLSNTYSTN